MVNIWVCLVFFTQTLYSLGLLFLYILLFYLFFIFLYLFVFLFLSRGASASSYEPPSYYANGFGSRASNNFLYSTSSLSRMLSRSPEWAGVSQKEKEKLGLTLKDDGEFWWVLFASFFTTSHMSILAFMRHLSHFRISSN